MPKNNDKEGYLAIVIHGKTKEEKEACILLLEESSDQSMPPIVLKTIPIYSDLSIQIAQSSLQFKQQQQSDLMVTISYSQESAQVIFPEKDIMSDILTEMKRLINTAAEHHLSSEQDNSHEWIKTYQTFGKDLVNNNKSKKPISRYNTFPTNEQSALRYVLPLKREDTIAKINLKRTRTVMTAKEKNITLREAKDHWINSQLMKREQEFVHLEKTT
ncbi:unnamed protein product [Rhizopus stolonifer]